MSDADDENSPTTNQTDDWAKNLTGMGESWQKAMAGWSSMWAENLQSSLTSATEKLSGSDRQSAGELMSDVLEEMSEVKVDSAKIMTAQMELLQGYQALWVHTTSRLLAPETSGPDPVSPKDPRFRDEAWSDNPIFEFIKKSYFLNSHWLRAYVDSVDGVGDETAKRLEFYGQQLVDALAPTNFPLTNPMVLNEMKETKGESLVRGMNNLMQDLQNGSGGLQPKQMNLDDFELGKDIATTPGSVVYETPYMQLIQYEPTTKDVHKKPLVIIPPWINKFYILDLREDNSFIKWAVGQGHTVFVVSWVNPDESYRDKSFDDYVEGGIFAALEGVEKATGEHEVNAIGYCIGGTLLAATLARMADENDKRISSVTFFAAQVDFEEAGELKLFTDPRQVDSIEKLVAGEGYLSAGFMASTFNMLRANDLIWFFHVNNYLLGKEPPKFDLLYWNGDSTRFPARLLIDYLRGMYIENKLSKPGAFELIGGAVDLTKITIPVYLQANIEDHIAPAESVYKATKLYSGPVRFVLGGSGHIAGVINPPEKGKYQYWTNTNKKKYDTAAAWQEEATEHPGSWWPDWNKWLARQSDGTVPARVIGAGKLKSLEPAPGSYVKVRS